MRDVFMFRNFGIGILIASFSLSSVNAALAAQVVETGPIVVQPENLPALNEQMLEQDRLNRDQELAIKGLADENQKLAAGQEDASLARINQTMLNYRDALLSRDRARIAAIGQKSSKYYDLIRLTENVDDIKDIGQTIDWKRDVIEDKYKILTQLKDEMMELNDKLKVQGPRIKVSEGQEDKVQMLTQRLSEMDQRIAHYDEVLAEKDKQIVLLKDQLDSMQGMIAAKNEMIDEQRDQINQLQGLSKTSLSNVPKPASSGTGDMELPPIFVKSADGQQSIQSNSGENEIIQRQEKQIAVLKARAEELFYKLGNTKPLSQQLAQIKAEIALKNEIIRQQGVQIDNLRKTMGLQLSLKQGQVELLKSELEHKIIQERQQNQKISAKDQTIKEQEDQIDVLKKQAQDLSIKEGLVKSQADQLATVSEKLKNQGGSYDDLKAEVEGLRNRVRAQDQDLKAKDDSIRWLSKVLAVAKNKAQYYKLTSQQDQMSMQQVQGEVQNIKDDFTQRFKNYDQFETAIDSLKEQVNRLSLQLTQKQGQVELLSSELKNKTIQTNSLNQTLTITQQDIKAELQDKDDQLQDKNDQIIKMKTDIQSILQEQANKEIYHRHALAQVDDRVRLARELIDLQQQETVLLDEKNELAATQSAIFEQRSRDLENRIKGLIDSHQLQTVDLRNRMQGLKEDLEQNRQQAELLKADLEDRTTEQSNQIKLADEIEELRNQLQAKENQIASMKAEIRSGLKTAEEVDALRQQVAVEQEKADRLQEQLDNKIAESNKLTSIMQDYQKKLESKDSAYNEQLGQILTSKNDQAQMEKQILDLNQRLQDKEAQVVTIKKNMYDLQQEATARDQEAQSKDLSLSMMQQKMTDQRMNEYQNRINALQAVSRSQIQVIKNLKAELELARQELKGSPSSDELEFLRTGLKKATIELKQKEGMLLQIKANADEYSKEFKQQSQEFLSLKEQLQNAYEEINHKNEDLKYKNLELIRFKERSAIKEGALQDQLRAITQKPGAAEKLVIIKSPEVNYAALSKNSPLEDKLKQALDKIDEQGRVINMLVKKLQEAGQTVDLSR
jgi:chromosome segregation ATPase